MARDYIRTFPLGRITVPRDTDARFLKPPVFDPDIATTLLNRYPTGTTDNPPPPPIHA